MDNDEIFSILQKQHNESQSKYTYFLLAAAGACIGFLGEKAQGVPITLSLIICGAAALVTWALSFVFGCLSLKNVQMIIMLNANIISVHIGNHPLQPQNPEKMTSAINFNQNLISKKRTLGLCYDRLQFWLFIAGGFFFVIWRIFEILRVAPA